MAGAKGVGADFGVYHGLRADGRYGIVVGGEGFPNIHDGWVGA